ncbi:MAG: DNA polymerase IV [Nitrospinota bacterium]
MREKIIIHFDLDSFFVSVARLQNSSLIGMPVIVGSASTDRGVVSSASYEARRFGVRSGMSVVKALKLIPKACCVTNDYRIYREYSDRVFEILLRFTPAVQMAGIDEAYLDLTGCQLVHKRDPLQIAKLIMLAVEDEVGLPSSIGIGSTRMLAKIGSKLAKPAGILYIIRGKEDKFLSRLPVKFIPGVGPSTVAKLAKLNINTIADLTATSQSELGSALGEYGAKLLRSARLEDMNQPFNIKAHIVKSIGKEKTFRVDITDIEFLKSALSYLAEHISFRVNKLNFALNSLTLKVRYSNFDTVTVSKKLDEPIAESLPIYQISLPLLTNLLANRKGAIRLIGLTASKFSHLGFQQSLFDQEKNLKEDALGSSLNAIKENYGFNSILKARSLRYINDSN